MKIRLLLRPSALEHFTSKHPVTKGELEGYWTSRNMLRGSAEIDINSLGEVSPGGISLSFWRIWGYSTKSLLFDLAKRMRRLYIGKRQSDVDGESKYQDIERPQ